MAATNESSCPAGASAIPQAPLQRQMGRLTPEVSLTSGDRSQWPASVLHSAARGCSRLGGPTFQEAKASA